MKKKITRLYSLFWACLVGYLFLSFSSNPPNGRTGSPPSFNTCSSATGGCHSGGAFNGTVTITGLPGMIDPNTTYPITVTLSQPNPFAEFGGFQMNVLDDNNNDIGTLSNPGPSSVVGGGFFEHSPAQVFPGTTITYTCDWTSPSTGNTNVTMYAAGLFADGSGGTSGDETVTTTAVGSFMVGGQIIVDVTGTNVSCLGGNDGTATATASGGGGGPYTYSWSNGGSGPTIVGLAAGTYTVTATNNNGGTPGTAMITITEPATAVTATITNTINIICNNPIGSATADGSGGTPGYTYNWSNGMTGPTINVTMGGTYTVTVTDVNGCTDITMATIEENTVLPLADAGPPMTITCANPTATLDGSGSSSGGNIDYQWTTVDGNIVSGANTNMPVVDAAGTYNLIVTDGNNACSAIDVTSVVANTTLPTAVALVSGEINCNTSQITLDGTGSSTGPEFSYLWTTANGNIVSGETTLMPIVDMAGEYTLTVTNNNNGCTESTTVSVNENSTPPIADAGPDMALNCNNTSVMLDGSGSSAGANISYLWTTVDGNIVSGETTAMPTVDAEGTYVLTVTDNDNGCFAADTVLVTQTPALTASISNETNVDCNGNNNGSATAEGSGGNPPYAFSWSNGNMTQTINDLGPGSYTVTVTDADNCTATAIANITEPDELMVTVATTDETSPGASDGTATANPTGGTSPFTYLWNTNETTQMIDDLAAGTYSVTVTDANGCTAVGSGMVNNFDCSTFSATVSSTDVTCFNGSDGTATATPSGGMMSYGYVWSDGQITQTATNLMAGSYTVTVLEGNGCMEVLTVMVDEPDSIVVSATSVTNVSCNGGGDGAIIVSAAGGNGGYSFIWSNGGMGDTLQNLAAGEYTVTATDSENCTGTLTVTITEPSQLNVNGVSITGVFCHGDSTGAVTVAANGGTPNYAYSWSDGGMGPGRTGLPAANYTVTATDANDCTATLQVIISQPSAINPNVTSTDETAVGAADGTASSMPTGGVGGYTFEWNTGATTATISNLAPGTYCVSVTDLNDCTIEECTTVNSFACTGASATASGTNVSCFGGNDGSAAVATSLLEPPLTYLWSNDSTTMSITDLSAGVYSVTVTDVNNCTATAGYEVTAPTAISVSANITNTECADSADGSIMAIVGGGIPPYTYEWSTGGMGPVIDSLAAGTYSLTVVDANGCMHTDEFEVGTNPDTELPNVVLQNITVELDANGMASITPQMLDNGTTDNCGIDTMIVDISDFTCDDLGENEVVVAVQDLSNNCGFDMAIVTVVDNLPPTISCPDDIVIQSSTCEEIVEYDDPTATDNCGMPTIMIIGGFASGEFFPSGTSTVSWEGMDGSGNADTCSFTVTIDNGFSAAASATPITCNGFMDGTATAEPAGGGLPYTYLWNDDDAQTAQTAIGLAAGVYSVTVSDANGCTSLASAEVAEPDALSISVDAVVNDTSSMMVGAIEVTVMGGTGDYLFEWTLNGDFFSTSEDLSGLESGFYQLLVSDDNGCLALSDSIFVDQIINTLDPALGQFVDLYPNPVAEKMFLAFELPASSEVRVDIFDLNGKLALPVVPDHFAKKIMEVDVSSMASGIYIVKIVVGDGVLVKRVVVGE